MKHILITLFLTVTMTSQSWSQDTWVKTFGGSKSDGGTSITTTPDGGYVITGGTESNDGDFKGMNKGGEDVFVIKLDSGGDILWKKVFGGSYDDYGVSTISTPDGGYILTGVTSSNDGDFKGMNKGGGDIFVVRLDSTGNTIWKRTFGGKKNEQSNSITMTPDGGYVLTGVTESNDGDFKGMKKGKQDIFVIKLDSNGNLQPSGKKSKKM